LTPNLNPYLNKNLLGQRSQITLNPEPVNGSD